MTLEPPSLPDERQEPPRAEPESHESINTTPSVQPDPPARVSAAACVRCGAPLSRLDEPCVACKRPRLLLWLALAAFIAVTVALAAVMLFLVFLKASTGGWPSLPRIGAPVGQSAIGRRVGLSDKRDYAGDFNNRGRAHRGPKESDRVSSAIDEVMKLNPQDASALVDRGDAWARKQQYDRAISDYDEAIRLDSKNADAFYSRGDAWAETGEFDRAIADYDEAIRLDPKDSDAFYRRGDAWAEKGNFDRAIADFGRAISLNPRDAEAFSSRGIAWRAKSQYERALADFDEAIRLDSEAAEPYYNRGVVWLIKREYDRAISDFDEAIRLSPQYAEAFANRGTAWDEKQEHARAISDYTEAIRLDPQNAAPFFNRGVTLENMGEYARALSDYDEALRLKPDLELATENRVRALAALRQQQGSVPSQSEGTTDSYQELRNALLRDGWVIVDREFEVTRERLDSDNSDFTCKSLEDNKWGCMSERLEAKQPSSVYADLLNDGPGDEEMFVVDFVRPMDPRFANQVRQVAFSVCGGNYGYECPGKPAGFLRVDSDKLISRQQAAQDFLEMVTHNL